MKTRKLEEILMERGLVREADIVRLLDSERTRGQPWVHCWCSRDSSPKRICWRL